MTNTDRPAITDARGNVDAAGTPKAESLGLISRDQATESFADRPVWVATARRGIDYHRPEPTNATTCGRTTRYGEILRHGDAVDRLGSKPCRRCYPQGDDVVPLVDGVAAPGTTAVSATGDTQC